MVSCRRAGGDTAFGLSALTVAPHAFLIGNLRRHHSIFIHNQAKVGQLTNMSQLLPSPADNII